MKKWRCPECGEITEYLNASITGTCTIDTNGEPRLEFWEPSYPSCEECGFEKSMYSEDDFELVTE